MQDTSYPFGSDSNTRFPGEPENPPPSEEGPLPASNLTDEVSHSHQVIDGLKQIYKERILPLEEMYHFDQFHSPLLRDSDFDAKPIVLLLGQYSVGKTSFIHYLLNRSFPGQRIGPEPTTDRFVAVMHNHEDLVIPGSALSVHADMPFRSLERFGTTFLNKFQASQCDAPLLEKITFIDTPGVLSGEKQRIGRSYDFTGVIEWFAQRADLILLLFDAHKLDISDEFRTVIDTLKGQDDKIRVVLNKADGVTTQQLMRVYGALMWSLGRVSASPEVMRVYIGSFWDQPMQNTENAALFEAERNDLLDDLSKLPRFSSIRKINELVKRARLVKVHSYIMGQLKREMPSMFGKKKKQEQLIAGLRDVFFQVLRQYNLSPGDFPNIPRFQQDLQQWDFSKFAKPNPLLVQQMDEILSHDIPRLMQLLQPHHAQPASSNPFDDPAAPDPMAVRNPDDDWIISAEARLEYDRLFVALGPLHGRLTGQQARPPLMETGVPRDVLRHVWDLADIDKDQHLDADEFAIAMHLTKVAKERNTLPAVLPDIIIPPSKKMG